MLDCSGETAPGVVYSTLCVRVYTKCLVKRREAKKGASECQPHKYVSLYGSDNVSLPYRTI